jgi:diguanylate cyclase (GGDEF)-like protein
MKISSGRFGGLGTRVAARTFALFCLCAIVPIVVSAIVADRIVSSKLRDDAAARLVSTSKSYGLLVFERLRQTEEALSGIAALGLAGKLPLADIRSFRSSHFEVVDVVADDATSAAGADLRPAVLSLHGSRVRITVVMERGPRRLRITAAPNTAYLWNPDAVHRNSMRICVHGPNAELLRCVGEEGMAQAGNTDRTLAGEWSLFLAPRYGAASWLVRTEQPASVALKALTSFERTLPIVTLIGIGIAFLLSIVQLRRSHRPLALLTEAVEHMGRRGARRHVAIDSKDEYGNLAQAFNRMTGSLARQFELFRTLAQIDRMILEDPPTDVLVEKILPALPSLLRASAVAVAVAARDAGPITIWWSSSAASGVKQLETGAFTLDELTGKVDIHNPALTELGTLGHPRLLYGLPIEVEGNLRGALLLADPESRGSSTRHARAFARRFAVALGSQRRRAALLKQAYYDGLTGLPNRQLFKDRLEREIAHARRAQTEIALIYIDLDRFKNVNDSMGHSAGDALLRGVSRQLVSQLRESDTLARLGGDEFVVIAPGPQEQPAHVLAERMQAALREPIVVQGATCFAQASIGLAVYPQDGTDVESLLRNADIAMYRSKVAGPGGVTYFEETMNLDAQRRLLVEQRLRLALRRGDLGVEYQAKVRLNDGSLGGFEALARWSDMQLGMVSPVEFISVAEECGLINELGAWVMNEACSTYRKLRQQGIDLVQVSVNVSMRQLRDERLINEVRDALLRHDMKAEALEIEVTESTLAGNQRVVRGLLETLRRMGVRIAIDDFGTGYSSMSVLGELPTDTLKIDRSFVTESASRSTSRSVVEAIVSIAHLLGKSTVAEGVETSDQVRTLRELGCDLAQGYFFAEPVRAEELPAVIARVPAWRQIVGDAVVDGDHPGPQRRTLARPDSHSMARPIQNRIGG